MKKDIDLKDLISIGESYSSMKSRIEKEGAEKYVRQRLVESVTSSHLGRITSFVPKSISLTKCALHNAVVVESSRFEGVVSNDVLKKICEEVETNLEKSIIPKELTPDQAKDTYKELYHHSDTKYGISFLSIGFSVKGKLIAEPAVIYNNDNPTIDIEDMGEALDRISEMSDFYFEQDDFYCDFAKSEKEGKLPILMAAKALTSDSIQGSESLNEFFGPKGRMADYLYKADGTARLEPFKKDAEGLNGAEKDTNVVSSFPIMHICAKVVKKVGESEPKTIAPEDFEGTKVEVIL